MSLIKNSGGWWRPKPNAIERSALDWLARCDRGMTAAEEAEFERWLAVDSRRAQMFSEFDGTWALLNRVRETPEGIAAAASGELDADAFLPTRNSGTHVSATPRGAHARFASWLAAAAALALLGAGSWWLARTPAETNSDYATIATTELGDTHKLNLPDGSIVHLNTDSAVEVRYTSVERNIRLARGEAHFTVARNKARPFIVTAAGVDVRAVGTAFNVRLRSEGVEVLVTEGRVRVNKERGSYPPTQDVTADFSSSPALAGAPEVGLASFATVEIASLSAGEKIMIPSSAATGEVAIQASPVAIQPLAIERALAWQERRLEFVSAPLTEVIAEFNRYNRHKLVITEATLGAQRFGGTFRPDDPAGFVGMLEANFDVVAEQRDGETRLQLRR